MARPKNKDETTSIKFAVRCDLKAKLISSLPRGEDGNVKVGELKAWLERKLIKDFGNDKDSSGRKRKAN